MRNAFFLLLALVVFGAGSVSAQMAATDLVPAGSTAILPLQTGANTGNITPGNPAALAWGMGRQVSVEASFEGTMEDVASATTYNLEETLVGARFVGEMFGFGLERYALSADLGGPPYNDHALEYQFSWRVTENISVGLGRMETVSELPSSATNEITRSQVGASMRLGKIFYVGAVYYDDTLDGTAPAGAPYKRSGLQFGAALRTEGPWRWYVAYDQGGLPDFPAGTPELKFDSSVFTVQVVAHGILVGVVNGTYSATVTGVPTDIERQAFNLGWVPEMGLSVTFQHQHVTLRQGGAELFVDADSLAFSWLF